MNKTTIGLAIACAAVLSIASCNKSENSYFGVSPRLTVYGAVNEGSWYKFRDSLGTAIDTITVTKVTNIFEPIAGESPDNLYQTITINFSSSLLQKESKVLMVRSKDSSTFVYTNALGRETTIMTEPVMAGTIIARVDSVKSGKYWHKDILIISESNSPDSLIYIAKGKWMVKKMYSTTPQQKWILDTLVIQ